MNRKRDKSADLNALMAISPVDGRYAEKVPELRDIFSEYGLIKRRTLVEVRWLQVLAGEYWVQEVSALSSRAKRALESIVTGFGIDDAARIKVIERDTRHDVKAVEYFLKEKVSTNPELARLSGHFHFANTSEDINNLAHGLMLIEARTLLLQVLDDLLRAMAACAKGSAGMAMLARTHGQPASPTTLGKEVAVFIHRLQGQIGSFRAVRILGKANGAVGNFNAHLAACPDVDWMNISKRFVTALGLDWNPHTTQIEPHDYMAEYFHCLIRLNSILIDFCRDVWGYISLGYFRQRTVRGEIGSSTMPHKVNPIDFENAEGNLGIANSLLQYMAGKLPVSRWQRDLTDSTTLRNTGTAIAHCLIAWRACLGGIDKLEPDAAALKRDLDKNWEVLAESVQTVMRRHGLDEPYEQIKKLAHGRKVDAKDLHAFIRKLDLPAAEKKRLLNLTPETYTGNAEEQARSIVRSVLG